MPIVRWDLGVFIDPVRLYFSMKVLSSLSKKYEGVYE